MWSGPGDAIAVWDLRNRRITYLTPQLERLREVTLRAAGGQEPVGQFSDASVVIGETARPTGADGAFAQLSIDYRRHAQDGAVVNPIGRFPGRTLRMQQLPNGAVEGFGAPIFDLPTQVTVSGDVAWFGTTERPELRQFDPDGTPRAIIRWADVDRRVTPAMKRDYETTRRRARGEPLTFAARLPTHGRLVGDGVGGVWMQEYQVDPPRASVRWFHLDVDGNPVEQVRVPDGSELLSASQLGLVVLTRGELGTEQVHVLTVER